MWALAPLLLATLLTVPQLQVDAFHGDEPKSLLAAGVHPDGPDSIGAVTDYIRQNSPEQALGWPVLLFFWGRIGGWEELTIRSLSFLAGMLTLAWVYRCGRDFFSSGAGVLATLLLASSLFFLAYMVYARVFSTVTLFSLICLWCYHRTYVSRRPAGKFAQVGLVASATGLLYSHFFAALLLPALLLHHLLFAKAKESRWHPFLLFALAGLLALPQLPVLLQGMENTMGNERLHARAFSTGELVSHLAHALSNGLVLLTSPAGEAFVTGLVLVFMAFLWRQLRALAKNRVYRYPVFVTATLLATGLAINQAARVIEGSRIRYLIPLWPLCALLAGSFLWQRFDRNSSLIRRLLLLWLCLAVWLFTATSFRYELGFFFQSRLHRVTAAAADQVTEHEGLVVRIDNTFEGIRQAAWMAQEGKMRYPFSLYLSGRDEVLSTLMSARSSHPFVWLMRHDDSVAISSLQAFESGLLFCERVLDQWGFKLERYTGTASRCPDDPLRLDFGPDIHWGAALAEKKEDSLRVEVHLYSRDRSLLDRYSLALHVIDPATDERVAQGDVGVGPGTFVPVRSDVDVSALPPGDFELRVALYDWRTGERLEARDQDTGLVSDMHVLQRFRVG